MRFPAHLWVALGLVVVTTSSIIEPSSKDNFELLILHNNDMHAKFEQTSQMSGACTTADREAGKCYGGFPRVAYVVKEARHAAATGQGPPVLYLNAGDTYTGTAWFTIYKWKIAAEFINALQPDAVSLGNHEFDNGVSGLTPFIENITSPVLAANLILNKEPTLEAEQNLHKSVVFEINGTKVGVIGYLTPETQFLAVKNNVGYIEEVTAIREEVAHLKSQGIKIIIALGHSGFLKDLEIAREVEDIDLVIGGHTNTFLWNGTSPDSEKVQGSYPTIVQQKSGRSVLVVQAYAYTKYLGKLHLLFDSHGEIINYDGKPVLLDKSIPHDPEVLDIVLKYRDSVMAISDVVVGNKSSIILDGDSCRIKECNMGNLICDAMVYRYAVDYIGEGWTDAPIAFIQGGGVRASIDHLTVSEITKGDLLAVMPFDGNMVKISLLGTTLLEMLERSVAHYNTIEAPGTFLQMSGVKVEYDLNNAPGMRVIKALVLCGKCSIPSFSPINKAETYHILVPSFVSKGGDGYSMLNEIPAMTLNYDELTCTSEYLQKHSLIYPSVEGRIIINDKMKVIQSAGAFISPSDVFSFILPLMTFMLTMQS